MNVKDILSGITDAPQRIEKYLNFTAVCQGILAGVAVILLLVSLRKK